MDRSTVALARWFRRRLWECHLQRWIAEKVEKACARADVRRMTDAEHIAWAERLKDVPAQVHHNVFLDMLEEKEERADT